MVSKVSQEQWLPESLLEHFWRQLALMGPAAQVAEVFSVSAEEGDAKYEIHAAWGTWGCAGRRKGTAETDAGRQLQPGAQGQPAMPAGCWKSVPVPLDTWEIPWVLQRPRL